MKLLYRTRDNEHPRGLFRIYFCAHPEEQEVLLPLLCADIHKHRNCAVWYQEHPEEALEQDLFREFNLILVAVTDRFLTEPSAARDRDLDYAIRHNIPLLPILFSPHAEGAYTRIFGDRQYLPRFHIGNGALDYDHKLRIFLAENTVTEHMIRKIRDSFDATFFLSYRKKDRLMARELIEAIHTDPTLRHIAIWYDEYLTPGDGFNGSLMEAVEQSILFILAVTRNMVGEENYVITHEYPMARRFEKDVLPVVLEEVDRALLDANFPDLPTPLEADEQEALLMLIREHLTSRHITVHNDPITDYYLALAYFFGIYVEQSPAIALGFFTACADRGHAKAADTVATMYTEGHYVPQDLTRAIHYRKAYADSCRKQYVDGHLSIHLADYVESVLKLAALYFKTEKHIKAYRILGKLLSSEYSVPHYSQVRVMDMLLHVAQNSPPTESLLNQALHSLEIGSFDRAFATVYKLLSCAKGHPRYNDLRRSYRQALQELLDEKPEEIQQWQDRAFPVAAAYSLMGSIIRKHFPEENGEVWFRQADRLMGDQPIEHESYVRTVTRPGCHNHIEAEHSSKQWLRDIRTVYRINRKIKRKGNPMETNDSLSPSEAMPYVDRYLAADQIAEILFIERWANFNEFQNDIVHGWLATYDLRYDCPTQREEALKLYEKFLAADLTDEAVLIKYIGLCENLRNDFPSDETLTHKLAWANMSMADRQFQRWSFTHDLAAFFSEDNLTEDYSAGVPEIQMMLLYAEKAYALYKEYLQREDSDAIRYELCNCSSLLGDIHLLNGNVDAAIECFEETFASYGRLIRRTLQASRMHMMELYLYMIRLGGFEDRNPLRQALLLAEYIPDENKKYAQIARCDQIYSDRQQQDGHLDLALYHSTRAVDMYATLYAREPEQYRHVYAAALIHHAELYRKKDRPEEQESALRTVLDLIPRERAAFSPELACLLSTAYLQLAKIEFHMTNTVTHLKTVLTIVEPHRKSCRRDTVADIRMKADIVYCAYHWKNGNHTASIRYFATAFCKGILPQYRKLFANGKFRTYFGNP